MFDRVYNRAAFDAEKYALRERLFGTHDVLPMWVADQDLPTPGFVIEALKKRLEHPILGYTETPESLYQAIVDWQAGHGYAVTREQVVFTHNVANGFHLAVQAFTEPGEAVLVQTPVYPPFLSAPGDNGRRLVEAPLVLENGEYRIDFDAFEAAVIAQHVKLFLFCHPQNPSGRVWTKAELEGLADICLRHSVVIVSDEIHSDLVYPGKTHIPMAALSPEVATRTVTLNSPGKTFNLGGLQVGYALIADAQLKARYLEVCRSVSIQDLNLFAMGALESAYSEAGQTWRDDLLTHFSVNIERVEVFFNKHYPEVRVMRPQASFLIWLDFRGLFAEHAELRRWLIEVAKLGFNDGLSFGEAGRGFMRMNIAVPGSVLEQALTQLKMARPPGLEPGTAP